MSIPPSIAVEARADTTPDLSKEARALLVLSNAPVIAGAALFCPRPISSVMPPPTINEAQLSAKVRKETLAG
jgi:hypothetical protein